MERYCRNKWSKLVEKEGRYTMLWCDFSIQKSRVILWVFERMFRSSTTIDALDLGRMDDFYPFHLDTQIEDYLGRYFGPRISRSEMC